MKKAKTQEQPMTAEEHADLDLIEHKIDLLLRLHGLTCEQICAIVASKSAPEAQQALIDKVTTKEPAKTAPATPA